MGPRPSPVRRRRPEPLLFFVRDEERTQARPLPLAQSDAPGALGRLCDVGVGVGRRVVREAGPAVAPSPPPAAPPPQVGVPEEPLPTRVAPPVPPATGQTGPSPVSSRAPPMRSVPRGTGEAPGEGVGPVTAPGPTAVRGVVALALAEVGVRSAPGVNAPDTAQDDVGEHDVEEHDVVQDDVVEHDVAEHDVGEDDVAVVQAVGVREEEAPVAVLEALVPEEERSAAPPPLVAQAQPWAEVRLGTRPGPQVLAATRHRSARPAGIARAPFFGPSRP